MQLGLYWLATSYHICTAVIALHHLMFKVAASCLFNMIIYLQRVVVVEDIKRVTALLQIEDQDADVILEQLDKLAEKIPSREVLEETGLGE